MNAVISGRRATALLIDGERLASIHADAIQRPVPRQPADLDFLFGECRDLQFWEDVTFEQAASHLKIACHNDNALQLVLILLDSELSKAVRHGAAEALEKLFAYPEVLQHVQSVLYAHDLPNNADMQGAIEICEQGSVVLVQGFLKMLHKLQPVIQKVSRAWNAIPGTVFGSEEKRAKWHTDIVREGIFQNLAMKIARGENVDAVHISYPLKPSAIASPEFGEIQRRWIEILKHEFPMSEKSTEQKKIDTETQSTIQPLLIDREWIASRREAVKQYLGKKWNLNGHELEEVLQETMVAALQSFDKYEARDTPEPGTYLVGIAKNVVQSYFRRRGRHERRRVSVEIAESIGVLFRDELETEELAAFFREKFSRLPKKYVQVLELIYYQDYKERDAAAEMGIPIDKFYSLKSDALKRLRKLCKQDSRLKSRPIEQEQATNLDKRLLPKHNEENDLEVNQGLTTSTQAYSPSSTTKPKPTQESISRLAA